MAYTDLTRTNYPDYIDRRTSSSDIYESKYNQNFELNSDKTTYIMADDINALQDAIIAMQRLVGTLTSTDSSSINYRLGSAQSSITTLSNGMTGHKHDGASGSPSKINLADNVTGELLAANIKRQGANSLTAKELYTESASNLTIYDALGTKFNCAAGSTSPVTGDLYIQGRVMTSTSVQWDGKNAVPNNNCILVTDISTYSGSSIHPNQATLVTWSTTPTIQKLRYGKYSVAIRMKLSDCLSTNKLGSIVMTNYNHIGSVPSSNATPSNNYGNYAVLKDIYKSSFDGSLYTTIYATYEHMPNASNIMYISVNWLGISGNLYIDDIVVTRMTTSVYDD